MKFERIVTTKFKDVKEP
jgi:hypothetical protein